jgi:acyl-CoA synthetase (AMP-forming)/AMP-acid ligase II
MLLEMAADCFGDRTLLGGRDDGITATELLRMSRGGAAIIEESGADTIVYVAGNSPAYPIAMLSAARAGATLVPVNYRLGAEQLFQLLANHPNAIGIADDAHLEVLNRAGLPARSATQWLCDVDRVDGSAGTPSDAPAVVIYTSGTTSKPKGVILRHEKLVSYVLGTVEFASAGADEAALISVPPYHIAAVANVITNLFSGRRLVTLESFQPRLWVDTVRREQITHALVVPTMLARIMEEPDIDLRVPSLRTLAYGGARMPKRIIERALSEWPDVDFVNAYGLTETSSTICVLGPDEHRAAIESDQPEARNRLSSAGRPIPGVEIEIRDDNGDTVSSGITGRIWVCGEQVSGEYSGSQPALDERGFFDTRDEGYLDADGYLYIAGRADDTIIRGAENIAPAEIEDALLSHPSVSDAVVVGVPDDEWGQRIEAAVVAARDAVIDPDSLRSYVRGLLRGSKTPDRIEVWADLPRTDTGKVVRRTVLDRIVATSSGGGAGGS